MNMLGVFIAFIEWYDAAVFIAFSNVLYKAFFPNFNNQTGLTISLALLSISCLGKIVGAYLIGKYSDEKSRIKSSQISLMLMIICSILLIFIPSYQQIGPLASGLFFFIKCIQGIAIGGNYSTSIYSIEQSKQKYFVSSLTSFSIFFGFLIANFYNALCISSFSENFISKYAWRIGFSFTGIFSWLVFYLFNNEKRINQIKRKNNSLKNEKLEFIKTCFLVLLDIVPFQYFHVFLPNYRIMILKHDQSFVRIGTLITLCTINIITPIIGKLADKIGPTIFMQASALMMILSAFFTKFNIVSSIFTDIYFGIMMALCYGTLYCYIPLKFNKTSRAKLSGVALHIMTSIILILIPIFSNTIVIHINKIFAIVGIICLIILINENHRKITKDEI